LNPKGYFTAVFSDLGGESDGGAPTANGAGCNGCGNCALMCPEVAIEVTRL
jgi:NAD-dependent dihydropyrimidine dehydrogenase PreA subunit